MWRLLWRSQEGVYASLQGELCSLVFNACGWEKGVVFGYCSFYFDISREEDTPNTSFCLFPLEDLAQFLQPAFSRRVTQNWWQRLDMLSCGFDIRELSKWTTPHPLVSAAWWIFGHTLQLKMELQTCRNLSEQTLGDCEGQGSPVCCSPWGLKESDTT